VYLAALDRFKLLMAAGERETAGDANTVVIVMASYLRAIKGKVSRNTYELRDRFCTLFCTRYGGLPVSSIKPLHASEMITQQEGWGNGTARIFVASIKAGFNWAEATGLIDKSPLRGLKPPPARSMGRVRVLSQAEHERVLADLAHPRYGLHRNLVIALENTGARPGELSHATVGDWRDDIGALAYYADDTRQTGEFRHKTAGRGKDRVIYFTGDALAMVRGLVKDKPPEALIFPTRSGVAYTDHHLGYTFRRIRRRVGIKGFFPYCYRHKFATEWLTKGGSVDVLATLLGNSAQTIRRHYAHLLNRHDDMRAALEAFRSR
jgi:integrase